MAEKGIIPRTPTEEKPPSIPCPIHHNTNDNTTKSPKKPVNNCYKFNSEFKKTKNVPSILSMIPPVLRRKLASMSESSSIINTNSIVDVGPVEYKISPSGATVAIHHQIDDLNQINTKPQSGTSNKTVVPSGTLEKIIRAKQNSDFVDPCLSCTCSHYHHQDNTYSQSLTNEPIDLRQIEMEQFGISNKPKFNNYSQPPQKDSDDKGMYNFLLL